MVNKKKKNYNKYFVAFGLVAVVFAGAAIVSSPNSKILDDSQEASISRTSIFKKNPPPPVCDASEIKITIDSDTPEGIQPVEEFNVLNFSIDNESNCDINLSDMKVAYMTTDAKPYFDEIQVRDQNTNSFLGENDELQEDINFNLGDRINIMMSGSDGLLIDAGDSANLTLRLVNYNQPVFDNTVPYNSYSHKYLLFGFIKEDDFDFMWSDSEQPISNLVLDYQNITWGKKVRIPVESLQP